MIDFKCEHCHQEFKGYPSKPRRYCSQDCANAAKSAACLIHKTCSHCGIEFKIKRFRDNDKTANWFCCKDHQSAFYVGKKATSPRPKTKFATSSCQQCGKEFKYWLADERKFCSQKCAKEASTVLRIWNQIFMQTQDVLLNRLKPVLLKE